MLLRLKMLLELDFSIKHSSSIKMGIFQIRCGVSICSSICLTQYIPPFVKFRLQPPMNSFFNNYPFIQLHLLVPFFSQFRSAITYEQPWLLRTISSNSSAETFIVFSSPHPQTISHLSQRSSGCWLPDMHAVSILRAPCFPALLSSSPLPPLPNLPPVCEDLAADDLRFVLSGTLCRTPAMKI